MNQNSDPKPDQTAAFTKLWSDSCGRILQAAMSYSPETAPPELMRQIRSGLMQALSQSWEEFLRSPQFLEGMKQMMDQAAAFQKFSAGFLTKARHATEGVAHDDVEGLRTALGQLESRLARQMDALSGQISPLAKALERLSPASLQPGPTPPAPVRQPKSPSKKPAGSGRSVRRKGQI